MKARIVRPTNTWQPWRPVRQKKIVGKAPSDVLKPARMYSYSWEMRKAKPIRNVSSRPARIPQTLPRLIDTVAQCIVALDVMRMKVLIVATKTGNSYGGVGHGTPFTIRTKK